MAKSRGTAFTLGQFAEVNAALSRALPKALFDLDPKVVLERAARGEELERALRGVFSGDISATRSDLVTIGVDLSGFDRDMSREGWTLKSDQVSPVGTISLELVEFLNKGETYINGDEMAKRAIKLGADLGQRHAEALLRNQHLIPEEWRGKYLVFPGTVWRGRGGYRDVPCLYWNGGRWCLDFGWLAYDWGSSYRLLRPASN